MTVDDLSQYGLATLDEAEIGDFLANRNVGVLGLPAAEVPSLRPMAYGYDRADDALSLLYVVGSESRKAELTDRTDAARFLAFSVETPFNWRSVLLTGEIEPVADDEVDRARAILASGWRPDLFERAGGELTTNWYRFHVTDRSGVAQAGLPPGIDEPPVEEGE